MARPKEKSVGILTRGYRGRPIPGDSSEIDAAEMKIVDSSDEVQLLAARLGIASRFGVGANRVENGSKLAAQGVNWFVLDDGFQHLAPRTRRRHRFDRRHDSFRRRPVAARRPAARTAHRTGPRRHCRHHSHRKFARQSKPRSGSIPQPQFSTPSPRSIPFAKSKLASSPNLFRPGAADRLFVFCGIGNPNGFIETLTQSGVTICRAQVFSRSPSLHRARRRPDSTRGSRLPGPPA